MKRPKRFIGNRQGLWAAVIAAAGVLIVIGGLAALPGDESGSVQAAPAEAAPDPPSLAAEREPLPPQVFVEPRDASGAPADGVALPTGGTPAPDIAEAVPGDDGAARLSLGTVEDVPESVRLDFLFEFCWGPCFRDAHFMDPNGTGLGSGPYVSGAPFHVRHGFVNEGDAPLPDGFDVVLYVTALDEPGEAGGAEIGQAHRYVSDYVVRGETDQCGPTYGSQVANATCEWFVHEFADGLPAGRHGMWAVWQAPCAAWVDMGFTATCEDPAEVMSFFSSGFDSPYDAAEPSYTEPNDAGLTQEELAAREADHGDVEDDHRRDDDSNDEGADHEGAGYVADTSGAAATGGSPLPDVDNAVPGDDGSTPESVGTVTSLPTTTRVDFLFEFCWDGCFRDGHFVSDGDPRLGSGPFTPDTPFHVRHGFANEGSEPLGAGFDVVLYVTALDLPGEFGGQGIGQTYRYASDYVVQGQSDACGPTYRSQDGSVTCEWFVHEFSDGLPEGRHALWAVWEAPCGAWLDYGFVDGCADPGEVLGLFTSGFDSPFETGAASFTERSEAP